MATEIMLVVAQMFPKIQAPHHRVLEHIETNNGVKVLTDEVLEAFVFITLLGGCHFSVVVFVTLFDSQLLKSMVWKLD